MLARVLLCLENIECVGQEHNYQTCYAWGGYHTATVEQKKREPFLWHLFTISITCRYLLDFWPVHGDEWIKQNQEQTGSVSHRPWDCPAAQNGRRSLGSLWYTRSSSEPAGFPSPRRRSASICLAQLEWWTESAADVNSWVKQRNSWLHEHWFCEEGYDKQCVLNIHWDSLEHTAHNYVSKWPPG